MTRTFSFSPIIGKSSSRPSGRPIRKKRSLLRSFGSHLDFSCSRKRKGRPTARRSEFASFGFFRKRAQNDKVVLRSFVRSLDVFAKEGERELQKSTFGSKVRPQCSLVAVLSFVLSAVRSFGRTRILPTKLPKMRKKEAQQGKGLFAYRRTGEGRKNDALPEKKSQPELFLREISVETISFYRRYDKIFSLLFLSQLRNNIVFSVGPPTEIELR